MSGYVSIHRKIADSWVWQKKPFSYGQAWIDMIMMANHKERDILFNGEVIKIEAGSFITSQEKLKIRWGWKRKRFDNFILNLRKTDMIQVKNRAYKGTYVSIVNYSAYQNKEQAEKQAKVQMRSKPGASRGAINNNVNNENNENKYKAQFDLFWNSYPKRNGKRVGKKATWEKFKTQKIEDLPIIIRNARNYGINNQYPKDPERFLKKEFWKDWNEPQTSDGGFNSQNQETQGI